MFKEYIDLAKANGDFKEESIDDTDDTDTSYEYWHGDILDERRRRVAAGEEKFIPLEEAMRQLREEVACR